MFKLNTRLKRISERMVDHNWFDLTGDYELSDGDLFNLNIGQRGENLFLGYFSERGLKIIMDKYNISRKLEKKGFSKLRVHIDTSDAHKHKVMVDNIDGKKVEKLVELVVKRDFLKVEMPFKCDLNKKTFEVLLVEWLKMQNPRLSFTQNRPQLPGQDFPGLGIGSDALELLLLAARRRGIQGLVNVPDHYHNAFFYSRYFYFTDPVEQSKLMALIRDTKKIPVSKVSWAIENKAVIETKTKKPLEWKASRQILPLVPSLKKIYSSWAYRSFVFREQKKYSYRIDN